MKNWKTDGSYIYVAAHRGWSTKYPENTMEAFRAAVELGVDQIEIDVRVTKDDELVVIHDAAVDRTTNGSGKVIDMTLDELKKLDAGIYKGLEFEGCRIPTLTEFMDYMATLPNMTVDFEFKEYPENIGDKAYEVAECILAMIDKYGFTDRCVINTFSCKLLEYFAAKHGNKYRIHSFFPERVIVGVDAKTTLSYDFAYCACMFPDSKDVHIMATKEEFEEMRTHGTIPWVGAGVKDDLGVDRAIDQRAQLITCNNPDVILKLLRDRGYHA